MIKGFKHKGLKKLFQTGSKSGVQAKQSEKLLDQLDALDSAVKIGDMDVPGWQLHELKGKDKGTWAVCVNGNWRVTFEFKNGDAFVVDYKDYH